MLRFLTLCFVFQNKIIFILDLFLYAFIIFFLSYSVVPVYISLSLLILILLIKIVYEQNLYAHDAGVLKIFGFSSLALLFFYIVEHMITIGLSGLSFFLILKFFNHSIPLTVLLTAIYKIIIADTGLLILVMPVFFAKDILKLLK